MWKSNRTLGRWDNIFSKWGKQVEDGSYLNEYQSDKETPIYNVTIFKRQPWEWRKLSATKLTWMQNNLFWGRLIDKKHTIITIHVNNYPITTLEYALYQFSLLTLEINCISFYAVQSQALKKYHGKGCFVSEHYWLGTDICFVPIESSFSWQKPKVWRHSHFFFQSKNSHSRIKIIQQRTELNQSQESFSWETEHLYTSGQVEGKVRTPGSFSCILSPHGVVEPFNNILLLTHSSCDPLSEPSSFPSIKCVGKGEDEGILVAFNVIFPEQLPFPLGQKQN